MIRWVDLLALILKAHGETLKALSLFFGTEGLTELLENVDENTLPEISTFQIELGLVRPPDPNSGGFSPYETLELAVRETELPAVLEFYVWTYPFYRALVEQPIDLRSQIDVKAHPEFVEALCNEALHQANQWIQTFQIPAAHRTQIETMARTPWLRLRSEVFKRLGRRPLIKIS